jgi:hypothetical protein
MSAREYRLLCEAARSTELGQRPSRAAYAHAIALWERWGAGDWQRAYDVYDVCAVRATCWLVPRHWTLDEIDQRGRSR